MEIFSARLKWLREELGLSQKEVADYIKMSPQGYGKIENGQREPNLEVLARLPKILGESVDFMIGVTNYTKEIKKVVEEIHLYKNSVEFAEGIMNSGKFNSDEDQDILRNYEHNFVTYSKKLLEAEEKFVKLIREVPGYKPIEQPKKDS